MMEIELNNVLFSCSVEEIKLEIYRIELEKLEKLLKIIDSCSLVTEISSSNSHSSLDITYNIFSILSEDKIREIVELELSSFNPKLIKRKPLKNSHKQFSKS